MHAWARGLRLGISLLAAIPRAGPAQDGLRTAALRAEDARPAGEAGLAPMRQGLAAGDSMTRRLAVRGLGRLERPDLVATIAPLLLDPEKSVRIEAVNAVAQSVARGGAERAYRVLSDRLAVETDAETRGVLFRSLGRLPLTDSASIAAVERLLLQGSHHPGGDAPVPILEGVTHGFFSLYRRTATSRPPLVDAFERLVELTSGKHPLLVRRLALAAVGATGRADSGALLEALSDDDWQVRRLAVLPAWSQEHLPGRERIVRRAWSDSEPAVRYEATRAYGRHQLARDGCAPLALRLEDPSPHIRLLVIDLLAQCGAAVVVTLRRMADQPFDGDTWHVPAHALASLGEVDSSALDSLPPRFLGGAIWWPRMYAARAALASGRVALLERLAQDPEPNVREAALNGLHQLRGHAADSFFVRAVASADYQLILTAAEKLDSTPSSAAAMPALLDALARLTAQRRETSRDPRMGLLTAIEHAGGSKQADALLPYLKDFDPVIAERAAAILTRWTGTSHQAEPRPLRAEPGPAWRELEGLSRLRPVIVMRGGGRVVLRLRPFDAPTNAARFVRMARAGWFDGLTFHRVVPNFVVQGGSPGANEYMGDGPFTRDELGLASHLRGTVGLSTRGRDTGDGQIFINLVDNIRLDHNYTIFAEVVEGMDVVDGMLEGAVIERVIVE